MTFKCNKSDDCDSCIYKNVESNEIKYWTEKSVYCPVKGLVKFVVK